MSFLAYLNLAIRVVHIFSAVLWIGLGFTMVVFIKPAIQNQAGYRFMKVLYTRTRLNIAYPIVSIVATLGGILLYLTGSTNHFSTTGNIVLGIGALAGLSAFGHGAAVLGSQTGKLTAQLVAALPEGTPASTQALAGLETSLAEYQRHARICLMLTVIALLGMGLARYL